jgi:hypothetical protein
MPVIPEIQIDKPWLRGQHVAPRTRVLQRLGNVSQIARWAYVKQGKPGIFGTWSSFGLVITLLVVFEVFLLGVGLSILRMARMH